MLNDAYVDRFARTWSRRSAPRRRPRGRGGRGAGRRAGGRAQARRGGRAQAAREKESPSARPPAPAAGSRSDDDAEGGHPARKQALTALRLRDLEQQIASEKERVERERQEARARARREGGRRGGKSAPWKRPCAAYKKPAKATPAPAPARQPRLPRRPVQNNFDSLLSQIGAEKQRMEAAKSAQADTRAPARQEGKKGGAHQWCPSSSPDDRRRGPYAQMAVQAEAAARQGARRARAAWPR
ncbi:MAG: hypothetical protein ACLUW6_12120 [Coriobacteriaceae bacterium]